MELKEHVAEIVSAYLRKNQISAEQLTSAIMAVYDALKPEEPVIALTPAVPVRRSLRPDQIVCVECGWAGKTIRRHLATAHGLTPNEHRTRWNLERDYPKVAASYSAQRSEFAKSIGLGAKRRGHQGDTASQSFRAIERFMQLSGQFCAVLVTGRGEHARGGNFNLVRSYMTKWIFLPCLFVLVMTTIAQAQSERAAERGRAFAQIACSRCHAIGPTGDSPLTEAPPFRDLHRRYPVEEIEESLAEGIRTGHPMPEFQLDRAEITDLLAYLKSLEH